MEPWNIPDSLYVYYRNVLTGGFRETLAEEMAKRAYLTVAIDARLEHACRAAGDAALRAFHEALNPEPVGVVRDNNGNPGSGWFNSPSATIVKPEGF